MKRLQRFTIEVTENEVRALYGILMSVGGDPTRSHRREASELLDKVYRIVEQIGAYKLPEYRPKGILWFLKFTKK